MKTKLTAKLKTFSTWLAVALLVGSVFGCAGTPPRNPVPFEFTNRAVIPGIPEARFWGDEWPKFSIERFKTFSEADFRRYFPAKMIGT